MPTQLLDLPPELIEDILALLTHQHAPSLSACRQTCRALNALIAQSHLVRYIERAALLGVYDPFVSSSSSSSSSSATPPPPDADADVGRPAMTIPERAAALEAWNDKWTTLDETLGSREPSRRFAMPSRHDLRSGRTAEVIISALALAPTPSSPPAARNHGAEAEAGAVAVQDHHHHHEWEQVPQETDDDGDGDGDGDDDEGDDEDDCHFSFGPWFVAAAREGPGVRAGYSYLDLRANLGGSASASAPGASSSCRGGKQHLKGVVEEGAPPPPPPPPPQWTTINVPVRNVVVFALSTELDLAVAISARVEREVGADGTTGIRSEIEVRPLRFRDGTSHPCAEVPTIGLTVPGASAHNMAQTQVLGDYLLLWIGGPGEGDFSLCKLYLIAWKRGSVTLLRDNPVGKYGTIATMISEDVFALVQLDPLGIELCRISHMTGDDRDGPPAHMDKLCTLLLPALEEGARPDWAVCVGEHPGHQPFSRGPWPAYRHVPSRRQFRQSTRDSILSMVMQITGARGRVPRIFNLVVRCATLLDHAHAAAEVQPAPPPADAKDNSGVDAVPWAEWGPRSASMSDHTSFEWNDLLGERRATVDHRSHQIRIYDYNPYRIRQARMAGLGATGDHRQVGDEGGGGGERPGRGDSDEDEEEVEVGNRYRGNGSRRITERSRILGGEWFREDVWTALPHLDTMIYKAGCKAIYMEQDQVLLQVNDYLDDDGSPPVEGFILYRM